MMINKVILTGILNTEPYLFNNDLNGTLTYVLELVLDNDHIAFVKTDNTEVSKLNIGTKLMIIGELGADILAEKQAAAGMNVLMKQLFIDPDSNPPINDVLLKGYFEGFALYGKYNQEFFKMIRLKTMLNGHIKIINVVLTNDLANQEFKLGDSVTIKGHISTYLNALLSINTKERYFMKAPSIIADEID